ncbi:MAG TPA: bifunctional isocitrate dehydrogenase kinase/phosphatase [Chloroflexota bacterium]|nr:bifunctional isocitrate dehydrogenase kinase/phosphatase [Chloroflexota bacterium]
MQLDLTRLSDSRIANMGAAAIYQAFKSYCAHFQAITERAPQRFEQQEWHGRRADAEERLQLYKTIIDQTVDQIHNLLDERLCDKLVWASMKAVYSGHIFPLDDWELAETFFNSVTRRIFTTVGVDHQIEFVTTDYQSPPTPSRYKVYRSYKTPQPKANLFYEIIGSYHATAHFAHLEQDCQLIAARIQALLVTRGLSMQRIDMVKSGFYRGQGAYLVGRIQAGNQTIPCIFCLLHGESGIYVDAVLLDDVSVSILFSFTRSYFHVKIDRPYDLVAFIQTLIPQKRVAEIYISLGYNKHGKTELYRDILRHLAHSEAQFQTAPGQKGMVMAVFSLPDYDLVFKLIKDRFADPKKVTRQNVMAQYEMVFRHDRAGRLVDAQSFEFLEFDQERFDPALLTELLAVAGHAVQVKDGAVVIVHAYVQRRVTPLDIYIRQVSEEEARAAIRDYGRAIKDMAATNIFPGDMLLKNFGVTRHGRVAFYDYDELRPLTDCHFRRFPAAATYEDELSDEPWFHIAEGDIFPEEFLHFMGLPPTLQDEFLAHHRDLLDTPYWHTTQTRLQNGEYIHILPYSQRHRLYPNK